MDIARITELLDSFLRVPVAVPGDSRLSDNNFSAAPAPYHSGSAKGEEAAVVLSPSQLQNISTYIDILVRWNSRINLTAVRDPEDIVARHFGESLFAARHLFPRDAHVGIAALGCPPEHRSAAVTVADVGSGAGFPGLPIKLWAPHLSLTLIESNHKKAAFLREITRALRLTDVDIQNMRVENVTGNSFDVVTLRAVERFETVLPIAAALVAPAGRLSLLIGASQQDQAQASLPRFTWSKAAPVPHSRARSLLIGHRQ
jgi:16S rRNA (guanine527-N7)-methyltransferase